MIFDLNEVETKKITSLFNQHEKNLDYLIYLKDIVWQNSNKTPSNQSLNDPYQKRDFLFDNLLKEHPCPNDFVEKNMKWETQMLRINDYLKNPYLQKFGSLSFKMKDWSLNNKKISAFSLFPYEEEYHYGSNYYLKMSLAFFDKDYFYPSISLCANEWMSLNPYEIRTMETPITLVKGKVLTLGLGLGYFAYMAHLKDEVKEVHIVEMDLDLINIFKEHFLPLFEHPEKIHIHKADAFYFVQNVKDHDYDYIFSDLWHDVSDGLLMYLKLKQFFRNFKYTQCLYWIESSIITYLRTLVIGIIKDEYFHLEQDYDELQLLIKNKLVNYRVKNNYDIDDLLNIKGLDSLLFS